MSKKNFGNSERAVFIGQIDTYWAAKDYQRGGLCLRVFAVDKAEFSAAALESSEGVNVVALDISYWQYCRHVLGEATWLTEKNRAVIDAKEGVAGERLRWHRFEILWDGFRRDGYAYRAFSDDAPRYFELVSASPIEDPDALPLRTPPTSPSVGAMLLSSIQSSAGSVLSVGSTHLAWHLTAFHVGQGMCSLISNGHDGYLIDAGAGTPVKRGKYLQKGFRNDLMTKLGRLKRVNLVISHADSDHWRLLKWDKDLRAKVERIAVPQGAKSITLQDRTVIQKVMQMGDFELKLSASSRLLVYRSQPKSSDDNGECLLVVFESGSKKALLGGDYVYQRYAGDGHSSIQAISNEQFDAVVVPHHGDEASAAMVVKAASGAKAFFSAGDHQMYKHPTQASVQAHKKANYTELVDKHFAGIRAVRLL